jgi:signal transduction histidine kinase/CheY-like chemotaxis protein
MRAARRGRLTRNFETRYVHKDGRVVTLGWTGVWSPTAQQHFFIGRDMTERLAAEERLRRAQRLEAIGQLTGGVAHDFNNLLAVIIGNLEQLGGDASADPEKAECWADALEAALRGAELTRQLLAFARRQSLNAEVLDINQRVSATISLLRRTLGEQITVETLLAADLWPALADPAQFEAALVNLAINARDAMAAGGRLTIETANAVLDESYARENLEVTPGNYVMIAMSDTGTGMAPDVLARVFEPFFTTKGPGKGTGLGLSMVYGFLRQSHGHIKVYSEVGHGTTVRLYLPQSTSGEAKTDVDQPAVFDSAKRNQTVLVVEDNAKVRKVVAQQLHELGYNVIEAENGEAALEVLRRGDAVDLLFTDVVMPGMSGSDLAAAARVVRPGIKVLFTTGFAKASLQNQTLVNGSADVLNKPYRKVDLATKIRSVLDSEPRSA